MNQDLVAQMVTEIEAARLLVYKAAWQKDQGHLGNTLEVAQAKYLAGEVVNRSANYALRILGAYGYSSEYPVARFYRDRRTYFMVEGSATIFVMVRAFSTSRKRHVSCSDQPMGWPREALPGGSALNCVLPARAS